MSSLCLDYGAAKLWTWPKDIVSLESQNSSFNSRFTDLNVVELRSEPGEVFTFEELEEAIVKNKAVALFVTHGETSSGTLQPLDGLGKICHKYVLIGDKIWNLIITLSRHNCLLSVDAVVSLGVAPIYVDRWEIDAINGGTQKGLSAPAGMCLLSFSPRA